MGCHALFQGIFPTQGLNLHLLLCSLILYHWATREALMLGSGLLLLFLYSDFCSPVSEWTFCFVSLCFSWPCFIWGQGGLLGKYSRERAQHWRKKPWLTGSLPSLTSWVFWRHLLSERKLLHPCESRTSQNARVSPLCYPERHLGTGMRTSSSSPSSQDLDEKYTVGFYYSWWCSTGCVWTALLNTEPRLPGSCKPLVTTCSSTNYGIISC